MASGHVNRTNRPNTWLHRPTCDVKKVLANSEPVSGIYRVMSAAGGSHKPKRGGFSF